MHTDKFRMLDVHDSFGVWRLAIGIQHSSVCIFFICGKNSLDRIEKHRRAAMDRDLAAVFHG
jgi:hypothetical protein